MRNIKLILEYDGTNFRGWQKQVKDRTVQGTLERAISKVTKEDIEVIGSSRTDSGVHAKAYVANFKTNARIPADKFKDVINTKLPSDVVVLHSEEAPEEFHARYLSKGKTYCYTILNRYEPSALERNYVNHFRGRLDIEAMEEACVYFVGKHDFEAFRSLGSSVISTVRTITDLHIELEGDKIKFFISADGFLYNMVRIIVGTLIQVGTGKIQATAIKDIINSKDRSKAGKCVGGQGLCLEKVFY